MKWLHAGWPCALLFLPVMARAAANDPTNSTSGEAHSHTTEEDTATDRETAADPGRANEPEAPAAAQRPKSVQMGTIAVDGGQAFGSAAQLDNSLPTLGFQLELMQGTRYLTYGGFARWGIGGIDAPNTNDSGLARLGPRLRLSTALDNRRPSLFITGSAGFGLAYVQRLENNPNQAIDGRAKRRTWGRANWNAFAAPGVGFFWPLATGAESWQLWDITLSASYYFTYWLQESSRNAPLATGWLEIALGVSGIWLP
jgi:hypothetical protein